MQSPFPGMDPFIESQIWEDFHTRLIASLSNALVPAVRPRYVVRIEERGYVENVPQQEREAFLTLRERESMEIVTLIELLSPGNKRAGSDGRREYLCKRASVLRSSVHLVELDLLRGGERLPTIEPLPPADYYAFICRGDRRPQAEVTPWLLRQPLPVIPVPLVGSDPDVLIDLQAVFHDLYDRAGYDYSLDYRRPVSPALNAADMVWVQQIVAGFRS